MCKIFENTKSCILYSLKRSNIIYRIFIMDNSLFFDRDFVL